MTKPVEFLQCTICSTYMVPCPSCLGAGCNNDEDCKIGNVCPSCCERSLKGSGWGVGIPMVALKEFKEELRGLLDRVLSDEVFGQRSMGWEPVPTIDSQKVNREIWYGQWHLGIEQSKNPEGEIVFKGLAEDMRRRLKVRLPSAWVQRVRQKVCPEAPGRSE